MSDCPSLPFSVLVEMELLLHYFFFLLCLPSFGIKIIVWCEESYWAFTEKAYAMNLTHLNYWPSDSSISPHLLYKTITIWEIKDRRGISCHSNIVSNQYCRLQVICELNFSLVSGGVTRRGSILILYLSLLFASFMIYFLLNVAISLFKCFVLFCSLSGVRRAFIVIWLWGRCGSVVAFAMVSVVLVLRACCSRNTKCETKPMTHRVTFMLIVVELYWFYIAVQESRHCQIQNKREGSKFSIYLLICYVSIIKFGFAQKSNKVLKNICVKQLGKVSENHLLYFSFVIARKVVILDKWSL